MSPGLSQSLYHADDTYKYGGFACNSAKNFVVISVQLSERTNNNRNKMRIYDVYYYMLFE